MPYTIPYKWKAIYNDDTLVEQINSEGVEISTDVIDRNKISIFVLLDDNDNIICALHLDKGQRLIYRRRTFVKQSGGIEDGRIVCHILGHQQTVYDEDGNRKNDQDIMYVIEGGAIHMAGKFREDHPLFYPIVLTDKEKELEKEFQL